MAHGFVRVFCPECKDDLLVAFSCKGRMRLREKARKRGHRRAHLPEVQEQVHLSMYALTVGNPTASKVLADKGM